MTSKQQDQAFLALSKSTSHEALGTEELTQLNQWMEENSELLDREIMSELPALLEIADINATAPTWDEFLEMNREKIRVKKRAAKIHSIKRGVLTAAAILVIVISINYFSQRKQANRPSIAAADNNAGKPGSYKATLGLADDQRIDLESASTGHLAAQGNINISKSSPGNIKYDTSQAGLGKPYPNTLTTPRGGEFHIKLADGTDVWLNAASQLSYPTVFIDSVRRVELSGEAYFEVAKDARRPFIVITRKTSKDVLIQVLGTKFNVNAYDNEPAHKVTLEEGSVRIITTAGAATVLRPGQEARIDAQKITVLSDPQSEQSLAWTKESFDFGDMDFTTVMHQLERWYNVSFRDTTHKPFQQPRQFKRVYFYGKISRTENIKSILETLGRYERFTYSITGNEIIISPY